MQGLFPKIIPGMIISKIHHIDLEDLEFNEIMKQIFRARRPHSIEVRRYDYQQDVLSGEWYSLQELRVAGKYVVDPRVRHHHFVEAGRRGEFSDLERCLLQGEEVNCTDHTGCTAFHHAAANGHVACCEVSFLSRISFVFAAAFFEMCACALMPRLCYTPFYWSHTSCSYS